MRKFTKVLESGESGMVWFVDHENGDVELEPCEMNYHHNRIAITQLAKYESMHEKLEEKIAKIKASSEYPHNFTGQMVEDLEWVINQLI